MEPDEEVVSDVHLFLKEKDRTYEVPDQYFGKYPAFRSRFVFLHKKLHSDLEPADPTLNDDKRSAILDDDGDLILPRKQKNQTEAIYIGHASATRLPDVGLQVWPGCMILCDFIIDNQKAFDNAVVVELGAGVGLSSIVAAMFSRHVTATDLNNDVLLACANNIALNKHLINSTHDFSLNSNSSYSSTNIEALELNWLSLDTEQVETSQKSNIIHCLNEVGDDCILDLDKVDILMASDVVYSDDMTDAFFRTVMTIMRTSTRCKTLYMSIEKRLNFTLEDLDVACPAYDHFRRCLTQLCGLDGPAGEKFVANIITDIPQYFEFQRSRYLELWKITLQ